VRLIDALCHYDALVARVPLSRWRDTGAGVEIVNPHGLRPMTQRANDGNDVIAMKADIDRVIDAMPARVRQLFHLCYRVATCQRDPADPRPVQWGNGLAFVAGVMRLRIEDASRIHGYHLTRMEAALADWFADRRTAA
jgi:hypothetical protein